jgi:hypothetical protein
MTNTTLNIVSSLLVIEIFSGSGVAVVLSSLSLLVSLVASCPSSPGFDSSLVLRFLLLILRFCQVPSSRMKTGQPKKHRSLIPTSNLLLCHKRLLGVSSVTRPSSPNSGS